MNSLLKRCSEYYKPLLQEFLADVEPLDMPTIEGMPEPFLPLFGRSYESSSLRLIVIGQDTLSWGNLRAFVDEGRVLTGEVFIERLMEFQSHAFTGWCRGHQTFYGFVLKFLATLHGHQDWQAMKLGKMPEILDSFAWANCNAVELYTSTPKRLGVRQDFWSKVEQAGRRLNRFQHIIETLKPHVALILYRGLNVNSYFQGCQIELVHGDGRLHHYRLPDSNTEIFHVPHPGSMNRIEKIDYFVTKLRTLFEDRGLTIDFPEFADHQQQGIKVVEFLKQRAPKPSEVSKFELVAWVADELKKQSTFMSVPALCTILNDLGFRTNYGTRFVGGRGSFRLVSATYRRMVKDGRGDRAENVAVAFRKPNFDYAYS